MIIFAALCFIVPGLIWGLYLLAFRMRSAQAVGTIVDWHGTGDLKAPVVEFELPDGRKITFTEPTHSNDSIFDLISDIVERFVFKRDLNKVNVLYDPNNPQKARVNNFTYFYSMPLLLFAIGFCMVLYTIPMFHGFLAPIFSFIERLAK